MIMPRKLFEPKNKEGTPLHDIMRCLANIARNLHDTYPEFLAVIPFGSSTKGLAGADSDVDIFLVFDSCGEEAIQAEVFLRDILFFHYPDTDIQVITRTRKQYEQLAYSLQEVDIGCFGPRLGPHRLPDISFSGSSVDRVISDILPRLCSLAFHNESSHFRLKKIPQTPLVMDFIRKRVAFWEKRIMQILGPQ